MKEKKNVTKIVLLVAALAVVFCTIVGATVAWLIDDTAPVVNTFTYGDINITLEETDTNKDGDGDPNTNNYPILPGNDITKDPKVTVLKDSENAWLFVKLEKSENFDDFMTFDVILDDPATTDAVEGWTALEGVDGVYYRQVDKTTEDLEYYVIKDNTVKVKEEVTKEMLNALDANGAKNYPTLTVTAYAVQRDSNITTAADAWAKIPANTTTETTP